MKYTGDIQPPHPILIKQICHKSFYKCPVGGYRSQWKCPYSDVLLPRGAGTPAPGSFKRADRQLSDPLAICREGRPAHRHGVFAIVSPNLRRFKSDKKTDRANRERKKLTHASGSFRGHIMCSILHGIFIDVTKRQL